VLRRPVGTPLDEWIDHDRLGNYGTAQRIVVAAEERQQNGLMAAR
jgi:hypothetical protein